jgi:hypothetical protein
MVVRTVFVFSLFLLALSALGGEKAKLHLTGNSSVDFFSNPELLSARISISDTTPVEWTTPSLEREKSPWLAGVLSLGVPGAGELYTKSYFKAAFFFAAEAASWIVAYSYNKKGDRQTDLFKAYANEHWSALRYALWTYNYRSDLSNGHILPGDTPSGVPYDPVPDGEFADCGPPFECVSWNELHRLESDIAAADFNGYTHQLPAYGEQQYYELIGKYDQFSRGWDDADQSAPTGIPIHSNSKRFYEYAQMRADANNFYDVAGTFVSVAVVNHIVSALDAFWSATRYNKVLHAEVKMRLQQTQFGLMPVTQAKVSYTF